VCKGAKQQCPKSGSHIYIIAAISDHTLTLTLANGFLGQFVARVTATDELADSTPQSFVVTVVETAQ